MRIKITVAYCIRWLKKLDTMKSQSAKLLHVKALFGEAWFQGRQSIVEEVEHNQKKLLDGFAHPANCRKCNN